jgi:hypothetical protein
MPDARGLSEAEGRAVLARVFAAAGYACREDVVITAGGATLTLDGYDEAARVGYEFLTAEAHDEAEFTPAAVAALEERMERGELAVLLVDEHEALTPEALERAATRFLERVKQSPPAARGPEGA